VRVDHAGQDQEPARVDLLARRAAKLGPHGDDPAVGHGEVALVAADEQVDVAHRASPRTKASSTSSAAATSASSTDSSG
jgi:hypothetical protein